MPQTGPPPADPGLLKRVKVVPSDSPHRSPPSADVNMFNVERSQVRKEAAWAILFTQPGGFTGHVMLVLMLVVYTTAHAKIRQQSYEAFWYTHQLVGPRPVRKDGTPFDWKSPPRSS